MRFAAFILSLLAVALGSCGSPDVRRFPLAPPMLVDPDRTDIGGEPQEYWSGLIWDGADMTAFYPLTTAFKLPARGPAVNVNAYDEVPDSSWFTNRIGARAMTLAEAQQGACPDQLLDTTGPWTVIAAKPNGANPGFIILDGDGRGWLLKFDGRTVSDERATTADVLGSRVYHAAGYWSPCNIVVYFDPDILQISPDAEAENELGHDVPMEYHHIEAVIRGAIEDDQGNLRASASLFVEGSPIGPWTYQGTRSDDPNDVIPHQDRREIRGARVLAAWLNHFDAREQNTLAAYVEDDDGGHVRHYYIDFGDCLGSRWASDQMTRRFGYGYYFDFKQVVADLFTLGLLNRPWNSVEENDVAPLWGYFDVQHFEPHKWRSGYRNPAFRRMRMEDGAWMARIIAQISEEHLRAMLSEGRMSNPVEEEEIVAILMGRRQRILDYYLRQRSPLTHFYVQDDAVCFEDLAALNGVYPADGVRYESRMYFGDWIEPAWTRHDNLLRDTDPTDTCVSLVEDGERPANTASGEDDDPSRYAVLDILTHAEAGPEVIPPARLHFYDTADGFVLAGIERPEDGTPPGRTR